jgi:predicted DNA-binding helix-hairpin-helix protein
MERMDLDAKLELLAPAARFDVCGTHATKGRRYTPAKAEWGAPGVATENDPAGKSRPVFRVLMSSRCQWNCAYCPLRSGSDTPRAALEPEELAKLFLPRFEAGAVQGLFLSTGVDSGLGTSLNRMLDGVELLRSRHEYKGYVHLKLLPGAAFGDVERAARLADRVSINLEAPGPEHLQRISPERSWHADLIERLGWLRDWQRSGLMPSGIATQFVVGAAGERDRDLLSTGAWLYRELGLRRVYFGAFRPAAGTPLEGAESTPQVRVRRLGEADWLLRNYGFGSAELPFDAAGDMPLHLDPKLAWALAHPELFPIELNTAPAELLLRVPGLGPVSVKRILRLRSLNPFRDPAHLKALGGIAARAGDFVTLDGRFFGRTTAALARAYAPKGPIAEQLPLFE